jgi:drug/metabolite transporter (DMT)-like permease
MPHEDIGMESRLGAYAALSGGFILVGSSVVAAELLTGLPVFFAAAGGTAVALAVLIPLAACEARPESGTLRRALPLLAAQAFFGIALFRVFMLLALARTSATIVGITTSATPALTALLSALFLKEKIGRRTAAGIALAALGIAALQAGGPGAPSGAAPTNTDLRAVFGCLLALGAAASESAFNVLSKRLPATIGPRHASAAVMALALLILGVLSIASGERVDWGGIGLRQVLAFAYMGLFSSALAYMLWFAGVARVPASTAGAFAGFMPLSSFALSITFLGEKPRAAAFVGAGLAMAGILLCAAAPPRGLGERKGRDKIASGS